MQRHSHIGSLNSPNKVGMATSFAKGRKNSLCCATNCRGLFVPPTYVCYRLRMTPLLHERDPPLNIYLCLKSVWMKICSFSVSNISCPVSVFHSESHSSNYGRILQSLQGKLNFLHTSHRINQLEILFWGPLKPAFNTECTPYMSYH